MCRAWQAVIRVPFFYQSFHHCLRPWRLIEDLGRLMDESCVIAFTGEPIQSVWWKDWGLRLDMESLFVARQEWLVRVRMVA